MCTRTGSSVAELKGQRVTDLRTPCQPHSPGQEQSWYLEGTAQGAELSVSPVLSSHWDSWQMSWVSTAVTLPCLPHQQLPEQWKLHEVSPASPRVWGLPLFNQQGTGASQEVQQISVWYFHNQRVSSSFLSKESSQLSTRKRNSEEKKNRREVNLLKKKMLLWLLKMKKMEVKSNVNGCAFKTRREKTRIQDGFQNAIQGQVFPAY